MNKTEELSYIIYMESKGYIFQDEKVPKDTSNSDMLAGEAHASRVQISPLS